jgi:uncharacterized protein (TIGR02145 family)
MIRKDFRMRNAVAVATCLAAVMMFTECGNKCDLEPKDGYTIDADNCKYVKKQDPPVDDRIKDGDGNVYTEVVIGEQTWLKENLKTTKYKDGTPINNITNSSAWASASDAGFCWYNNQVTNKNTYGALYNYYATVSEKICPEGWRVPDGGDWTTLITTNGSESEAGTNLKEEGTAHWSLEGGTNSSGFTALPSGQRKADGTFEGLRDFAGFWTTIPTSESEAQYVPMEAQSTSAGFPYGNMTDKKTGLTIRCIKNQ